MTYTDKPAIAPTHWKVWVLSGSKAGDTTQMLALANALGWQYEIKKFVYRPTELLSNLLLGATLAGINQAASSSLQAPWPDLVITAGRRNEPVARWIKKRSQGKSCIVHMGRPWSPLDDFDLIITTPQYFVPIRDNVLEINLPLHRVTAEMLNKWRQQWASQFKHLPKPIWSILLGGDSGPYIFTSEKALQLANWLNQSVGREGGSVLVTNSARTPVPAYRAFLSQLEVPVQDYDWRSGSTDNPYQGYLACADRLVVTGESMSMLSEATATGKPLYIFDMADCPAHSKAPEKGYRPWWQLRHNFRYKPLTHRLAMQFAPQRMKRDISRILQRLVNSGRAIWVGDTQVLQKRPVDSNDLIRVVERVHSLLKISQKPGSSTRY